jgi:L-fuculose-phosphate aldolase
LEKKIQALSKEIIEAGRRAYEKGFIASNDGNISARISKDKILITPSGISKGFMKPADLILLDIKGRKIKGRKNPSSESYMHLQIYKDRPDINSVCHFHPPYATGFAVAGIPLDKMILTEVIITLGTIPLVEYGTTGTPELYEKISRYIKDYDAFLLANHGALTIGSSVFNAYYKMETLEHAAMIQFLALQLGSVNTLTEKQTDELIKAREKFGIRKDIGLNQLNKKKD